MQPAMNHWSEALVMNKAVSDCTCTQHMLLTAVPSDSVSLELVPDGPRRRTPAKAFML